MGSSRDADDSSSCVMCCVAAGRARDSRAPVAAASLVIEVVERYGIDGVLATLCARHRSAHERSRVIERVS